MMSRREPKEICLVCANSGIGRHASSNCQKTCLDFRFASKRYSSTSNLASYEVPFEIGRQQRRGVNGSLNRHRRAQGLDLSWLQYDGMTLGAANLEHINIPVKELAYTLSGKQTADGSVPLEVYGQSIQMAETAASTRYLAILPAATNVLDIAAGLGFFSRALFESRQFTQFKATWIDRDTRAMDEGVKDVVFGANVRRVPANLVQQRWIRLVPDRAFDCAVIGVLHHHISTETYQKIVRIVTQQKLRAEGRLVLVEVCGGLFPRPAWNEVADDILLTLQGIAPVRGACLLDVSVSVRELSRTFRFLYLAVAVDTSVSTK
jgi:hypothetical protein